VNILVVARWQEDIGWLDGLPDGWTAAVVHKDIDLPNHGREPTSFLWWIVTHYEKIHPGSAYGFVQGNPFGHVVDLWDQLTAPGAGFRPLSSSPPFRSTGDGSPHHHGVPVADCHHRWLGVPMGAEVEFWPGGQFRIDGTTLLRHPQQFYRRVFDDLMMRAGLEPWAAERLWPAMFADERWT
jgi:hypothetical protein